jgi:DNA invertase Pin-like site-specific DNA recombinase
MTEDLAGAFFCPDCAARFSAAIKAAHAKARAAGVKFGNPAGWSAWDAPKISRERYQEVKDLLASGLPVRTIARRTNVSKSTVGRIRKGWQAHVP